MVIRTFEGATPDIHESAYVDDRAVVIGDVAIEKDASVWPNATLRGDDGPIRVGEGTSVQDGCVFHEDAQVGAYVTVGHNAIVHGCRVGDHSLIGMGSVVLSRAEVGERSIVAAGAVVREGDEVPPETLVAGVPATPVKDLSVDESYLQRREEEAGEESHYVELARRHRATSEPVDRADLD